MILLPLTDLEATNWALWKMVITIDRYFLVLIRYCSIGVFKREAARGVHIVFKDITPKPLFFLHWFFYSKNVDNSMSYAVEPASNALGWLDWYSLSHSNIEMIIALLLNVERGNINQFPNQIIQYFYSTWNNTVKSLMFCYHRVNNGSHSLGWCRLHSYFWWLITALNNWPYVLCIGGHRLNIKMRSINAIWTHFDGISKSCKLYNLSLPTD